MFSKKSKYFQVFSVGVLSISLTACGGSGSNFSDLTLTTLEKQIIAKLAVESTDIFELVDTIITVSNNIESLASGSLTCVSGSGTQTIVNNVPTATFDDGDSITIIGSSCVDSDGDSIDGTLEITGTSSGRTATFTNVATSGGSVNGSMDITPSSDYVPASGTGSIQIDIGEITGTSSGVTTTLQNGSYNLALSGGNYTYTADHEVTSNQYSGVVKAQTDSTGFTGTTSIVSDEFLVSNPVDGTMTITLPDATTATLDANSGNASTYNLTVDNQTTTVFW